MGYKTTSAERIQATSAISSAIAAFNNPDGSGFALTSTALTEGVGLKQYTIIPGTNPVNSETSIGGAVITAVAITDSNYAVLDDTALATTGGYVKLTGTGFKTGCIVYVGGVAATTTTFVSSTEVRAAIGSNSSNTFTVSLANPDGSAGFYMAGIAVSGVPAWSTNATLSAAYEQAAYSQTLTANSNSSIAYSLKSGSTLPSGVSLDPGTGVLSGTSPADTGTTTYTFTIIATDAENQDTERLFSLTINTDTVTWSSPAAGTSYTITPGSAASNISLSASALSGRAVTYSANTLPTGLTLSNDVIFGTISGSSHPASTLLTATNSYRPATRVINWNLVLSDLYFKYNTLLLSGDGLNGATWISDASTNNFDIITYGDAKATSQTPFNTTTYPTSGSGYFDGAGDLLQVPSSANLTLGTGDFTLELWVYPTSWNSSLNQSLLSGNGTMYGFGLGASQYYSGKLTFGYEGVFTIIEDAILPTINAWTHVACTRSGNVFRVFLNGTQSGSTITYSADFSAPLRNIGSNTTSAGFFNGYISNVRVLKGTALYTTTFTPPTAPLTAIANTSLLTLQSRQSANNNSFNDSGSGNFNLTRVGAPTQGTFSPFSETGFSTYFNGSSQGMVIPSATFSGNWVNSNFTFEAWLYVTGDGPNGFIWLYGQNNNDCLYLGLSVTDRNINYGSFNGLSFNYSFSTANNIWQKNQWFHVAFVRNSTSGNTNAMKIFLDGVLVGTGNTGTFGVFDNSFFFNNAYNPWADLNGYCAGLRLTNSALYSTTFTPAPLTNIAGTQVLLCTTRTKTDASSNNYPVSITGTPSIQAFTPFAPTVAYSASTIGGSGYFDGTSDAIYFQDTTQSGTSSDFNLGAGNNASIDHWFYLTATTAQNTAGLSKQVSAPNDWNGQIWYQINLHDTSGNISAFWRAGANYGYFYTAAPSAYLNQWNHIAFASDTSNNLSLFLNGTRILTTVATIGLATATNYITFGQQAAGQSQSRFKGYMTGLRFIQGSGAFNAASSTITVPTAPPTSTATTKLLLNFTNAGIYDATGKNDLQTVGTAKLSSVQSKYGGTSMKFNGTSDYLYSVANGTNNFSTGDFTIECWINFSVVGNGQIISAGPGNVTNAYYWQYYSSQLQFGNQGVANIVASNWTPIAGTWYHIAVTRNGTSVRQFVDGTQLGTTGTSSANLVDGPTYVGYGGAGYLNGYLDDLRVTKGIARYTTSFTPPTAALLL